MTYREHVRQGRRAADRAVDAAIFADYDRAIAQAGLPEPEFQRRVDEVVKNLAASPSQRGQKLNLIAK